MADDPTQPPEQTVPESQPESPVKVSLEPTSVEEPKPQSESEIILPPEPVEKTEPIIPESKPEPKMKPTQPEPIPPEEPPTAEESEPEETKPLSSPTESKPPEPEPKEKEEEPEPQSPELPQSPPSEEKTSELKSDSKQIEEEVNKRLDEHLSKIQAKGNQVKKQRFQENLNRIVNEAKEKGRIDNTQVQLLLHVSQSAATKYLRELSKQGKLKKQGKGRGVHYVI